VFDGLAALVPSNAEHVFALVAQPLGLGRGGVALVVVRVAPAEGVIDGLVALNTHVSSSRPPPAPASSTTVYRTPTSAGEGRRSKPPG
jgi:hypothetical protein